MAYTFLYRTNVMNTEKLTDYFIDLFNKGFKIGKNKRFAISRCNIVDFVENMLPSTNEMNGSGLINEFHDRVGIEEISESYTSKEKTIELAVADFFNTSKHDFTLDLWDVDSEVEDTETGEMINIQHFDEWDF